MASGAYEYDLVVIGAGPGGYVAAIRAAQLGGKVACIEREYLGGTCLNWGCIPTKAIIAGVERLMHVKHAGQFGIQVGEVGFDFNKLMSHKSKVVTTLRAGIGMLFKKNNVTHIQGTGSFVDAHTISVVLNDGSRQSITTRNVIIATGSEPIRLPIPGLDGDGVWTSNEAVNAPFLPQRLVVIGGGVIGCEFAFAFNGMGSQVTVVELMPRIIPTEDTEMGRELQKSLTKQGIAFHLESKVKEIRHQPDGSKIVVVETASGDKEIACDIVLVGVGRRAVTQGLNLEAAGLKTERKIAVNERMETVVPGIYAVGDVTQRIQLAHVASAEGIVAATNAMGGDDWMDYRAVPSCIYTSPEVASVGLTEEQAIEKGYSVKVGRFQLRTLGKALAMGEREGMAKVVADTKYGEILGVHIIGPHATDMIGEPTTAIQMEALVDSLTKTIHPHPTLLEGLLEAYEDVHGKAIHI